MKTTISNFVTPEVDVRFSNLVVDSLKKHFTMTVGTRAIGKRKFTEKQISGNITSDLADWFSLLRDEKVKVAADNEQGFEFIKTGRKLTNFQKYLTKRGIEQTPNILNSLVFESPNDSQDYALNPFRLVVYTTGKCTLTLVNVASKKKVSHVDVNTGETTDKYYNRLFINKEGKAQKSFIIPQYFRRLMVQETKEIEVMA